VPAIFLLPSLPVQVVTWHDLIGVLNQSKAKYHTGVDVRSMFREQFRFFVKLFDSVAVTRGTHEAQRKACFALKHVFRPRGPIDW
jgi:hypothetical protein